MIVLSSDVRCSAASAPAENAPSPKPGDAEIHFLFPFFSITSRPQSPKSHSLRATPKVRSMFSMHTPPPNRFARMAAPRCDASSKKAPKDASQKADPSQQPTRNQCLRTRAQFLKESRKMRHKPPAPPAGTAAQPLERVPPRLSFP